MAAVHAHALGASPAWIAPELGAKRRRVEGAPVTMTMTAQMPSGGAAVAALLARTRTPPVHGAMRRQRSPTELLYEAAARGDATECMRLARAGADVGARLDAYDGASPLTLAVAGSRLEAVRALVAAGASVHRATCGETVVQLAARLAHVSDDAAAVAALVRARRRGNDTRTRARRALGGASKN